MVAPKDILFESWYVLRYIGKLTSIRLRFMAGDRDLRIYLLDPLFIYKIRRAELRRHRAAVKRGKANSFKLPNLENRQYTKEQ